MIYCLYLGKDKWDDPTKASYWVTRTTFSKIDLFWKLKLQFSVIDNRGRFCSVENFLSWSLMDRRRQFKLICNADDFVLFEAIKNSADSVLAFKDKIDSWQTDLLSAITRDEIEWETSVRIRACAIKIRDKLSVAKCNKHFCLVSTVDFLL